MSNLVNNWMTHMSNGDTEALLAMFANDAEVVRFPGIARGKDEIRAYLVGLLSAHGRYQMVSLDQVQEGSDSVIWEATVETKAGPLQSYGVMTLDADGKIVRHFPGIQGYWGSN